MLRHRLIAGTVLALAIVGVMLGDAYFAPYSPLLLLVRDRCRIVCDLGIVAPYPNR